MFCTESIKKGNKADSFKLSTEIHLIQSLIGQTAAMEMRVALRLGSLEPQKDLKEHSCLIESSIKLIKLAIEL